MRVCVKTRQQILQLEFFSIESPPAIRKPDAGGECSGGLNNQNSRIPTNPVIKIDDILIKKPHTAA